MAAHNQHPPITDDRAGAQPDHGHGREPHPRPDNEEEREAGVGDHRNPPRDPYPLQQPRREPRPQDPDDPEPPPEPLRPRGEPPRRGWNINWKWVVVGVTAVGVVGVGVGVGGFAVYYLYNKLLNKISDVENKLVETKRSVQAAMAIEGFIRDHKWLQKFNGMGQKFATINRNFETINGQLLKNTTDLSQLQKTVDSLRENAMRFVGDMAKPQE